VHLLVTGGTGVLGRAFRPLAEAEGHQVSAPGRAELDLFDPAAVGARMRGVDAVLHLATRIRPLEAMGQPGAWRDNDRLRAEASAILVDAALAAEVKAYIQPTVTFVYPDGQQASEQTAIREDVPVIMRSALAAEEQATKFAAAGRHGVVLRLGLLDGPGTGHDQPNPALGASLHTQDAGRALLARSPSRAASTTSAATGSGSATGASPRPPAGARGTDTYHHGFTGFHPAVYFRVMPATSSAHTFLSRSTTGG
jgi:nucleoside-diphosphate-sugar epimerase